jgi:glycosyltransferase involved in cell wall biosynthesis
MARRLDRGTEGTAASVKIVQVFNRYLQPGGEEKSVGRIAEDLEAGGHSVVRFWRESSEWQGPSAPARFRQPWLLQRNPAVLADLAREHHRAPADLWVLHNVVPVVSLGVYRLARDLGVPVFQWLHNYRPVSPSGTLFAKGVALDPSSSWGSILRRESLAGSWNGRLATLILAWAYARLRRNGDFASVRAWIAVSDEMRRIFERARWYPDRLYTLRHSWHAQPAPPEPLRDDGYFLFLGRMVETKGVRFLIELWRRPEMRGLKLVMAGAGPLADELRSQSSPNIEWIGHVEGAEKQRWKAGCRAVLFPSIWAEPLSTVAYEAYELGKPIVASALGGMPEVIVPDQTGLLLPASKPEAWCQAIVRLSQDAAWAASLGAEGRRWLDREVSPRRWAEQFDEILRRTGVAENKASRSADSGRKAADGLRSGFHVW